MVAMKKLFAAALAASIAAGAAPALAQTAAEDTERLRSGLRASVRDQNPFCLAVALQREAVRHRLTETG